MCLTPYRIKRDDLTGPKIRALLEAHLETMRSLSPPESIHALDLEGLRKPEITFWTIWENDALAGCGALKRMSPTDGEIKSMHTAKAHRGKGIAEFLLRHALQNARDEGLTRLSLETGAQPGFEHARRLYAKHGFVFCGPFGDYRQDPNSVFMMLDL